MRSTVLSLEPIRGFKNLTVQWGAQFSPHEPTRGLSNIELSNEEHIFPHEPIRGLYKLNHPMRSTNSPVSGFEYWTVQWGGHSPWANQRSLNVELSNEEHSFPIVIVHCTNVQYVFWENIEPIFYTFYLKTEHIHIVQIIVTVHYSIIYELEQNMYSKAYCEIL